MAHIRKLQCSSVFTESQCMIQCSENLEQKERPQAALEHFLML